ncbi:hypothetical protein H5410_051646 [Solanum commersonii]|uniref:Uncharacterized protein n=1 Tax=Solanum commersonii TaxID=4109 RepID=A0A9J5WZ09_SOLCO|nr:hypothetical protein H5410_051646 [Solanum commersonii]
MVEVLADLEQMLSLRLQFLETDQLMMVSIVYAKCEAIERLNLWNDIYHISSQINDSPLFIGIGGLPVDFAFCVNSCELVGINFKGSPVTWWNGRIDYGCIFKRFDRYLMN